MSIPEQSRSNRDETRSNNSSAAVPSQTHHEEQTSNTQQVSRDSRLLWTLLVSFATIGTFQGFVVILVHLILGPSSDLAAAWAGLTGCAWVFFLIGLISAWNDGTYVRDCRVGLAFVTLGESFCGLVLFERYITPLQLDALLGSLASKLIAFLTVVALACALDQHYVTATSKLAATGNHPEDGVFTRLRGWIGIHILPISRRVASAPEVFNNSEEHEPQIGAKSSNVPRWLLRLVPQRQSSRMMSETTTDEERRRLLDLAFV